MDIKTISDFVVRQEYDLPIYINKITLCNGGYQVEYYTITKDGCPSTLEPRVARMFGKYNKPIFKRCGFREKTHYTIKSYYGMRRSDKKDEWIWSL